MPSLKIERKWVDLTLFLGHTTVCQRAGCVGPWSPLWSMEVRSCSWSSNEPSNGRICFDDLFLKDQTSVTPVQFAIIDVLRDIWRGAELEREGFSNRFHPVELDKNYIVSLCTQKLVVKPVNLCAILCPSMSISVDFSICILASQLWDESLHIRVQYVLWLKRKAYMPYYTHPISKSWDPSRLMYRNLLRTLLAGDDDFTQRDLNKEF